VTHIVLTVFGKDSSLHQMQSGAPSHSAVTSYSKNHQDHVEHGEHGEHGGHHGPSLEKQVERQIVLAMVPPFVPFTVHLSWRFVS
jgi:hypothetical protein